jgi:hypothetical protein
MEAVRCFYNQERCHSRCHDQPPAIVYQPSPRRLPPDFDLHQVPITWQPMVVTRQVQGSGQVSLAGSSYPFSQRYAGQTLTVTVNGWQAPPLAASGARPPGRRRLSVMEHDQKPSCDCAPSLSGYLTFGSLSQNTQPDNFYKR